MASEDFVIDIGLRLNDKEARAQVNDFYKNQIVPLQKRLEKVQRGSHDKLTQDFVNVAHQYHKMMGGAITPAQAVRYTAGGTPTAGTARRGVTESATHLLQKRLKEEDRAKKTASQRAEDEIRLQEGLRKLSARDKSPLERVQDAIRFETQQNLELERIAKQKQALQTDKDMQKLYLHLGGMEAYTSPLEKVQDKIRQETLDNAQQQIIDAKNAEERRLAIEEHQAQMLEIIANNTGLFKKWSVTDKAIIQREQRRILSSKRPGEELSEYQKKVMGVSFGGDLSKTVAKAGGILALVTALTKLAYNEATRESSLFNKQAATTGYSLSKERLLSRMGVTDPVSAMSDIATFYDKARLGELPFEGFGMFAPQTYATRMQTQDPLAIWRAFKADVAAGEAKGWSRETIAQKTGMQAWLPTLNKTEAQVREWAAEVESGKYQDERAQVAYDIKTEVTNIREMLQDTRSKHKTGMWAGGALGAGLGIAAGIALAPVTGGASIPASIALASTLGTAGAVVGANAVPAILETPGVAGGDIKSSVDALWNGRRDIPNVTLNMTVDREVVDEINNGGKYTRTFSGSQISELY